MVENIVQKWWFKWLVVGVLFRLILMPITAHPDIWGQSIAAYFFLQKGVINIYDHLVNLPADSVLAQNFPIRYIFIYPPLTYFTLGISSLITTPFADVNFIPWLMVNVGEVFSYPGLKTQLFLFKLPHLFLDIAIASLLSSLFSENKKKKIAFLLWMLNPLSLYTTFMVGQNDIFPVFFTVLSLYFFRKRRIGWALISLGIGGSYKLYPLLFIIPAVFVYGSSLRERIRLAVLGILPYVLTVGPFLLSPGYRRLVLLNPESTKILFMRLHVSGAEVIYTFIFLLFLLYFHAYYATEKLNINTYFIAILLLIFSVTHYHSQWFLWLTPFLIVELVESNFKYILIGLTLFACWFLITLFFEPSLSYGLFAPISPDLGNAVGLTEVVSQFYDPYMLKSIIRSIFAAASLYYILSLYKVLPKH